jgi:ADP-ribose pyrophosphatase YjhB (NUDIX family)
MFPSKRHFTTAVIIIGPNQQVVLVKNEHKPPPHYWKFPGGRNESEEAPVETAVREIEEETGLIIPKPAHLAEENRGNHWFYLFGIKVESFNGLKETGEDGEIVSLFPTKEIENMTDFFPPHRLIIKENNLSF